MRYLRYFAGQFELQERFNVRVNDDGTQRMQMRLSWETA